MSLQAVEGIIYLLEAGYKSIKIVAVKEEPRPGSSAGAVTWITTTQVVAKHGQDFSRLPMVVWSNEDISRPDDPLDAGRLIRFEEEIEISKSEYEVTPNHPRYDPRKMLRLYLKMNRISRERWNVTVKFGAVHTERERALIRMGGDCPTCGSALRYSPDVPGKPLRWSCTRVRHCSFNRLLSSSEEAILRAFDYRLLVLERPQRIIYTEWREAVAASFQSKAGDRG